MRNRSRKNGFTLVELLIVIAILAILTTVTIVSYITFMEKAKRSNDEKLVANINRILQAEEIFIDSHVAPLDIKDSLEEKGFTLKTKSKDVDLFYNSKIGRVELGNIDNYGVYSTVYPVTENSDTKIVSSVTYLEQVVDGYILIGQESSTKISNSIFGIRNANSSNDIGNSLSLLQKTNDKLFELISSYVSTTLFVGSDDNIFTYNKSIDTISLATKTLNDDSTESFYQCKNCLFTTNATSITDKFVDILKQSSIQIIDIPKNTQINEEEIRNLAQSLIIEVEENGELKKVLKTTIVASSQTIDKIAGVNKELADLIIKNEIRNTVVKKAFFTKYYKDEIIDSHENEFSTESNTINLSSSDYFALGCLDSKAYGYPQVEFRDNKKPMEFTNKANIWTYNYKTSDAYPDQDGYLYIDMHYDKVDATAKIGDQYYLLEIAIMKSFTNTYEDKIVLSVTNASIDTELILASEDTLVIPRDKDDIDGEFNYLWGGKTTKVYATLTINANFKVQGKIKIGGTQSAVGGGDGSGTGFLTGSYGLVKIENSGKIMMQGNENSQAEILVAGKIEGSNALTEQLLMNEYSLMTARMSAGFWYGGTRSTFIQLQNIFPLVDYSVEGIECLTKFNYKSKLNLNFAVNSGSKNVAGTINLISHDTDALLVLNDGANINIKTEGLKSNIEIYGNVSMKRMSISISEIKFDTNDMLLPINGNFKYYVKNDATLNVNLGKGVKLLPGSYFEVEENATVNVDNSSVYLYEWAEDPNGGVNNGYRYYYDGQELSGSYFKNKFDQDARFINNGLIICHNYVNFSGNYEGSGQIQGSFTQNNTLAETTGLTTVFGKVVGVKKDEVFVTRSGSSNIPWSIV